LRESLKSKVKTAGGCVDFTEVPAGYQPAATLAGLEAQGQNSGWRLDAAVNPDILSLQHILLYGIRGLAAYTHHARVLGREDDTIYAFLQEAPAMACGCPSFQIQNFARPAMGQLPGRKRRRLPLQPCPTGRYRSNWCRRPRPFSRAPICWRRRRRRIALFFCFEALRSNLREIETCNLQLTRSLKMCSLPFTILQNARAFYPIHGIL